MFELILLSFLYGLLRQGLDLLTVWCIAQAKRMLRKRKRRRGKTARRPRKGKGQGGRRVTLRKKLAQLEGRTDEDDPEGSE